MKKLIIILMLSLPIVASSQAMIGSSANKIRATYPEKTFKTDYTKSGNKYISATFNDVTFCYYLDENNISTDCMAIPKYISGVNSLVERYNGIYTIISSKEWKAYLANGEIMNIKLFYSKENEISYFRYLPD